MEFAQFKTYFHNIKERGNNNFTCICPAHEDKNNSLEVWLDENDYIAMKCYAHCSIDKILRSLRLEKKDLVTENARNRYKEKKTSEQNTITKANNSKNNSNQKSQEKPKTKLNIVEEYNYCNVDGKLMYQVIRLEPKDFRMRQIDATGRWSYSIKNVQKVIYNLPNVVNGVKENKTIYIVEGEKDVNNINALGLIGTTNVGGASSKLNDSKWLPEYNEYFKGADVVVLPDSDEAGFRHAYNLYSNLYKIAKSIKFGIFNEKFLKEKFDVSDVIKHYNIKTKEELFSYYEFKDIKSFEKYLEDMQLEYIIQSKQELIPSTNIDEYDFLPGQPFGYCQKTGYRAYQVSDVGNAMRVFHLLFDKVRYNLSNDKWYIWNDSVWACDNHSKMNTLIRQALDSLKYAKAIITEDMEVVTNRKDIFKYYFRTMQSNGYKAVVNFLRQFEELTITQDQLDNNVNLFNLSNGTYDLQKKELLPHIKSNLLSKKSNIYYNEKATCNNWLDFLDTIFDYDQELISFVQRAVGLTLSGASMEEVLFFCYGSGKNGKSIFFNVLKLLFGDYYRKADVEMILQNNNRGIPNDIAQLPGSRLVVFSEIPADRRFNESLLKDLTGNDDIQARFLHKEFFTFKPTHTLWLYGNHKPIIRGSDYGIWRRMIMIPFTVTIPADKQVPASVLLERFEGELAGILNWAIEGYKQYLQQGLNPPSKVRAATNQYKDESDTVLDFINECCVVDSVNTILAKELYIAYSIFCKENDDYKLKNRSFFNKIEEKGYVKFKNLNGNMPMFKNITLNDKYKNLVEIHISGMLKTNLFKQN